MRLFAILCNDGKTAYINPSKVESIFTNCNDQAVIIMEAGQAFFSANAAGEVVRSMNLFIESENKQ